MIEFKEGGECMLRGYYGDKEFTMFCIINSMAVTLMPKQLSKFITNESVDGSKFITSRLDRLKVEVDITIPTDVLGYLDALNKIFYTREPKKLYFSNRPDRYLLCIPDGEIKFSSTNKVGKAKLVFISPDYFWRATRGTKEVAFIGDSVVLNNEGTAPTYPRFDVYFTQDCGFLSIISPHGYMALGNPIQEDNITVPPSEVAVNASVTSMQGLTGWQKLDRAEITIPDYKKLSSTLTPLFSNGITVNGANVGSEAKWYGHAYIKEFEMGTIEKEADIMSARMDVGISNVSSGSRTMALLFAIFDENDVPIMTTSVYDVGDGKNELTVTCKIRDGRPGFEKHSKIIRTNKMGNLNGNILMEKRGNKFTWTIQSDKTVMRVQNRIRVGQSVHINPWATHAETGHPILAGYHGLTYTVGSTKIGRDGSVAYRLDNGGWPIYWIYERDIQEAQVVSRTSQPSQIYESIYDSTLAQFRPKKVLFWQGVWGGTQPYDQFNISKIKVDRHYSTSVIDIKNAFKAGDHLYIDNDNGDVMLNGSHFQGAIDFDSRAFPIDGGLTAIRAVVSSWAVMPRIVASYESRWL